MLTLLSSRSKVKMSNRENNPDYDAIFNAGVDKGYEEGREDSHNEEYNNAFGRGYHKGQKDGASEVTASFENEIKEAMEAKLETYRKVVDGREDLEWKSFRLGQESVLTQIRAIVKMRERKEKVPSWGVVLIVEVIVYCPDDVKGILGNREREAW